MSLSSLCLWMMIYKISFRKAANMKLLFFTNQPLNHFKLSQMSESQMLLECWVSAGFQPFQHMKADSKDLNLSCFYSCFPPHKQAEEQRWIHRVASGTRPANQRQQSTTGMRWVSTVPSVCRADKQTAGRSHPSSGNSTSLNNNQVICNLSQAPPPSPSSCLLIGHRV